MRILIATVHRNLVGGAEKYLEALLPALAKQQHQVAILHENRCDWNRERIDPAGWDSPVWCALETGTPEALRLATAWKPDVVYSQGLDSVELESALAGQHPTVLYSHAYYGTCISGRKCHALPHIEPCARALNAACLVLYYPRRCGGLDPRTAWRMFRMQEARKSLLPRFRAILVASEHMREEFVRNGVPAGQVQVVPLFNPDGEPTSMPSADKTPEGRILFVGRLIDVKGAQLLIQALPAAGEKLGRRLSLVVAGDGAEREKLQNLANKLGVSVQFAGWVDRDRKHALMRDADLLAVPSLWPEPFGLVGIEAGSLGLPAVAYAAGGIPDWLISGVSGELAPTDPPTVQGLADALVRALADSRHYNQLREGARKMASRYSLQAHLSRLEPVLAGSASSAERSDFASAVADPVIRASEE
jgi:glycosyltransferase involved in cell wall biosynthesis